MRFNSRELALLAGRKSEYFDKEGVLSVGDKNDLKKNKKDKVLSERFCRLKGNLLFIFKGKEKPSSDASGKVELQQIYMLEQTTITKDSDRFSFTISFPGDDKSLIFTCSNHLEQCDWVSALQNASYETLRLKLRSLRQDIIKKTGNDPLLTTTTQNHISDMNNRSSERQSAFDEDSVLEMCLSCADLTIPLENRVPNGFVAVSYMSPPQSYWTKHAQTEIIENCGNPHFMTYIVFNKECNIHESTQIKLSVYDIKDRNNGATLHLGNAVLTVQHVFQPEPVTLPLMTHDGESTGSITVLSWQSITCDSSSSDNDTEDVDEGMAQGAVSNPPLLSPSPSNSDPTLRYQELLLQGHNSPWMNARNSLGRTRGNNIYGKVVTRKYRFPTSEPGRTLSVIEYMAESAMTILVPKLYLRLLRDEERESLAGLERLGTLRGRWLTMTNELVRHHQGLLEGYTGLHEYITSHYHGVCFKPSVLKTDGKLAFVPVNVHVARLRVLESQQSLDRSYDIITCGAFTVYGGKTKHGLKRALEIAGFPPVDKGAAPVPEFTSPSWLIGTTADRRRGLGAKDVPWTEAMRVCRDVDECCIQLNQILSDKKLGRLNNQTKMFTNKVNELLSVVSSSVIEGVVICYEEARDIGQTKREEEGATASVLAELCNSINKNATTMLSDLIALADTADPVKGQSYLLKLTECLGDFEKNFRALQKLLKNAYTLMSLQRKHEFLCGGATENLQQRRDSVFSQALSVCVCGFLTMLHSCYEDAQVMLQISSAGIVVHFESLLSTFGEDSVKLEDMHVAVNDLVNVKFIIALTTDPANVKPVSLQGQRGNVTVVVHVDRDVFDKLPNSLKSGKHIGVRPVLFTVGINEQQTIAEKIGDTSLQDQINYNSFIHLTVYFNEVKDMLKCDSAASVETLLPILYSEIISRKNKNVKILHLAQEICREMNSLRLTSCKSGKDRTSMAVTLEFCQLLTAKHDLSEHEFRHALDCLRSNGTRLENTLKNTGCASYAFNNLQLQLFPKDYRPPEGTYGNITT